MIRWFVVSTDGPRGLDTLHPSPLSSQAIERLIAGLVDLPDERIPLVDFVRQAWRIVEPDTVYIHSWHVEAICLHLEALVDGRIQHLLINMPPRFLKSLISSVFYPAWIWTFKPEYRMLYCSYSQDLSVRDAVKTRRIIESHWYRSRWGAGVKLTGDQNQKMRYENTRQGTRISSSVGGLNTGEGGNLVCADDPHNVLEAYSAAKRGSAIEWWNSVMTSRLNDQRKDHKLVIAQRIHEQDLSGEILKKDSGYVHLCLPNEFVPDRRCVTPIWQDPRTEEGEFLCYNRLGPKEVDKIRSTLGDYGYSSQYQQDPLPPTGGLVPRDWWQTYDEAPRFTAMAQSWDLTFKKTVALSYVVGQVWGFRGAYVYLVFQIRSRLSFTETITAMLSLTSRFPDAHLKLVEDKANGPAVMDTLRSKVPGIIPVEPFGSKEARAQSVTPLIQSGNVWIPDPEIQEHYWVNDFIEEWMRADPLHWDQIDASSQLLTHWARTVQGNSITWGT